MRPPARKAVNFTLLNPRFLRAAVDEGGNVDTDTGDLRVATFPDSSARSRHCAKDIAVAHNTVGRVKSSVEDATGSNYMCASRRVSIGLYLVIYTHPTRNILRKLIPGFKQFDPPVAPAPSSMRGGDIPLLPDQQRAKRQMTQ